MSDATRWGPEIEDLATEQEIDSRQQITLQRGHFDTDRCRLPRGSRFFRTDSFHEIHGLLAHWGHSGSERERAAATGEQRAGGGQTPTEPRNLRSHGSFVSLPPGAAWSERGGAAVA